MSNVLPLPDAQAFSSRCQVAPVFFSRRELDQLLQIYGRMVAAGAWRDYSIEAGAGWVSFSAYRRAAERADLRIVKEPALARRQGAFRIVNAAGAVLKRGAGLPAVLKLFETRRLKLIEP